MTELRSGIRPATHADESAVHELAAGMATTFAVDRDVFGSTFRRLAGAGDALLLVADDGGRVCGYVLGSLRPTFYANGPVAWVEEIAVHPDLRRRGLGSGLMAGFERWAGASGARMVALATRRADTFYAALGYEPSATYFRKRL